jgi:hypothetical protein
VVDNYQTDAGSGGNDYFSDDIGGVHAPLIKIMLGALDANDGPVSTANPMPIDIQEINGTAISIGGGVEAGALLVTIASDSTGVLTVDDGGGSLTVDNAALSVTGGGVEATALRVTIASDSTGTLTIDNPTLSVVGGGVEATALRVTIANDSTGLVSVDDGGGSLTVDGTVTADAGSGNFAVNVTQVAGTAVSAGSGTVDAGTIRVTLATDDVVSIDNDDLVSTNNSTTTPLGISGNFTGTGDDCLGYTSVTVQLFADQDGSTDGMLFQFSTDNSNWDESNTFTYTASEGRSFQFPVHARYFRVNFTNGTTGQGVFRVQTLLHRQNVLTSIHRVADNLSPDRSATLVKAVVAAQAAGAGDFVPVQATSSGNFKTALEEIDAGLLGGGVEAGALLVTIASDSTGLLSVDDNGGSLTVDAPVGTPVNVQVGDGTNTATIRNLAANDALNVAIVDAAGDQITSFGGGTQYAEDTAHVTGDTLTLAGVVQQSADSALSGDGDRSLLQVDASGYLKVNVKAGAAGGVSHIDNAAFTGGTDDIVPMGALYDTTPPTITDGNAGIPRMTSSRVLMVDGSAVTQPISAASLPLPSGAATAANQLADGHNVTVDNAAGGAAVNIQDGGNSITIDGTSATLSATVVQPTASNLNCTPAQATHDNLNLNANIQVGDADVANGNPVPVSDAAGSLTVDQASPALLNCTVVQSTPGNLNANVGGLAAHDAAVAGNPVLVGFYADNTETSPVSADGDAVRGWADRFGRQVVVEGHPPDAAGAGTHGPYTENQTASGDQELIAAPGASTSIHVTGFWASNQGSSKNRVSLREGAAGTERYKGTLAADGGGVTRDKIMWVLPANTALTGNLGAAGDVDWNIDFFVAPTPA